MSQPSGDAYVWVRDDHSDSIDEDEPRVVSTLHKKEHIFFFISFYTSSSNDNNGTYIYIWQALPVDNDDDIHGELDEQYAPASAAAYLRMVRKQAAAMPDICTADVQCNTSSQDRRWLNSKLDSLRMAPVSAEHIPCERWQAQFLQQFESLQQCLTRQLAAVPQYVTTTVPDIKDRNSFRTRCLHPVHPVQPSLAILATLDARHIEDALDEFDQNLPELNSYVNSAKVRDDAAHDNITHTSPMLQRYRATWLFALLALLQR